MEKKIYLSGPDPTLELAYPDVWLPNLYSRRVFVFELQPVSSYKNTIKSLEKALQALVLGVPELGSETRVVPAQHDKPIWRALKPYKGIELVVKDCTESFPSFARLEGEGFPLAFFEDQLLMPIPLRMEGGPSAQAKIQVTLIEGGLLLSTCFLHHLADGTGMNVITHALATACKQAAESNSPIAPITLDCDRSLLQTLSSPQTDLALHPAYRYAPNQWVPRVDIDDDSNNPNGSIENIPNQESPILTPPPPNSLFPPVSLPGYFRLTPSAAARLHDDAQPPTSSGTGTGIRPVSTHDAITALLWRTLIRARHALGRIKATDTATVTFPHNARRHLGLAPTWVGNCVYFCVAQAKVADLVADGDGEGTASSLPVFAGKIRGVLGAIDRDVVAGLMRVRREEPYSLSYWAGEAEEDMGIVGLTSFYHSGLLGMDWGPAFGPVRHFTTTDVGPLAKGFERTSFVGPKLEGVMGCDVMVGADPEEMEFVIRDVMWNRYFEPSRS